MWSNWPIMAHEEVAVLIQQEDAIQCADPFWGKRLVALEDGWEKLKQNKYMQNENNGDAGYAAELTSIIL